MEYHDYVICKLTQLIEMKCNCLEIIFLQKFGELSTRYDRDMQYMKETMRHKFERTNRHIDESVFTVLDKSHRFECDLEKIYKKLLILFAQPNQQHISRALFLKDKNPNGTLDISQYKPPECKCVKEVIPCDFEANNCMKCCCFRATGPQADNKNGNVGKENNTLKFLTPAQRRKLAQNQAIKSIGRNQSPVEITTSRALAIHMPAIELIGYRNLLPAPLKLINNGHTLNLFARTLSPMDLKLGDFLPYVIGGKLEGQYEFEYLQFHWGSNNWCGAEHILNDIQYSMEVQVINRNKKYKDLKTALCHPDGIAGLAFLYRISEYDAPEIEPIVMNLQNLKNVNDIVEMDTTFSLSSLLGNACLDRFYTYKGSLTLPPYSEVVTWVIFPDALQISSRQIGKFRQLIDSDNYRDLQQLGNRRIFLREGNIRDCRVEDLNKTHYSKWQWYI